jgi:hypothetical protein
LGTAVLAGIMVLWRRRMGKGIGRTAFFEEEKRV